MEMGLAAAKTENGPHGWRCGKRANVLLASYTLFYFFLYRTFSTFLRSCSLYSIQIPERQRCTTIYRFLPA